MSQADEVHMGDAHPDYETPLPARYNFVLYSHYAYEKEDFAAHNKGVPAGELPGVLNLREHLRGLKELLTTPGHEGLLVLFYGIGFEEFVSAMGTDDAARKAHLLKHERLKFARIIAERVRQDMKDVQLSDRVRFMTPLDLEVILGDVKNILKEHLGEYF